MAGLAIPSSRALSVIGSSQYVMREQPETTAVVTRMAQSFVRFGSFEHWYYRKQHDHLKTLADYVLANFYPELQAANNPYQALLQEVTRRTAELIAQWQAVGFMHGVLNTDNMSILGITLDYGPFGFMESFNPRHICNHTDQHGRYSYAMQPQIGYWNCCALAQALLPLIGEVETTQAAIADYQKIYLNKINQLWHAKLGLRDDLPGDDDFIQALLTLMQENSVDFTLFFRRLGDLKVSTPQLDAQLDAQLDNELDAPLRDLFMNPAAFDAWAATYRQRLQQENTQDAARQITMHAVNPKYVLRNYLAQVAIEKAQAGDFSEVQHLHKLLERPFDEQPEHQSYAQLPPDWASHLEVSCSS